jgi:hypothetical protein
MSNRMTHVTLENYTSSEVEWLGEMIAEKLIDMGYEGIEGFAFSVEVDFEIEQYDNKEDE